jgi:hypothetical protein
MLFSRFCLTAILLPMCLTACSDRPKAPARFSVPEGWKIKARAEFPPGKLEKQRVLAEYQKAEPGKPLAMLEISAADLPESTNLAEFLSTGSFGVKKWIPVGTPESIEAGGKPGTRLTFKGVREKESLDREVTAFRKGDRVYFFNIMSRAGDASPRDSVRRSLSSIVWSR